MCHVHQATRHGALHARATGRLAPAAERMINLLGFELDALTPDAVDAAAASPDGLVLPFFWWPVPLSPRADGWRVHAPLGLGDDPDDLSALLGLHLLQLSTARRFGADPTGFDLHDAVHLAEGALDAPQLMLRRAPSPEPGSTGWHVRPDGPLVAYEDAYTALPAVELFSTRTALLIPLALPPGWFVRMVGDEVVEARAV
jgi:hypothetical protein